MSGHFEFSTTHDDFFIAPSLWAEIKAHMQLSPRQAAVVRLVLRGRSDRQIASELGCAIPTVRTHLSRLFARLNVQDRVGLILYVFAQAQRYWQARGELHVAQSR